MENKTIIFNELNLLNPSHLKNNYKKIYYESGKEKTLPNYVHKQIEIDKTIGFIVSFSTMTDNKSAVEKGNKPDLCQIQKK